MGCCFSEEEITTTAIVVAEYSTTKPYRPVITRGRAVKVYDGDTLWVAATPEGMVGNPVFRFNIRMLGYDSPEIRTKNPKEKEAAVKARDALSELLSDKIFRIEQCEKSDKYGRLLATLYVNDNDGKVINVNKWMIEKGFGYPYDGGKKQDFM